MQRCLDIANDVQRAFAIDNGFAVAILSSVRYECETHVLQTSGLTRFGQDMCEYGEVDVRYDDRKLKYSLTDLQYHMQSICKKAQNMLISRGEDANVIGTVATDEDMIVVNVMCVV